MKMLTRCEIGRNSAKTPRLLGRLLQSNTPHLAVPHAFLLPQGVEPEGEDGPPLSGNIHSNPRCSFGLARQSPLR